MKNLIVIVLLLTLSACSRGSGTYIGQVVDVGWEGWIFSSCETRWKTSEQASTFSDSSSRDPALCNQLQASIGKKYKVRWRHQIPHFTTNTKYIIEAVEPVE